MAEERNAADLRQMPIFELFSTRKSDEKKAGRPDVFIYDEIPKALRTQMQQILRDAIGGYHQYTGSEFHPVPCNNDAWEFFRKTLCREYGVHSLTGASTSYSDIMSMIADTTDGERILDTFELAGKYPEKIASKFSPYERNQRGIQQAPDEAIEELNFRFRAASVGFQYENGIVVRVDSHYAHSELVKPALKLLAGAEYEGPQAEFLQAHNYYRRGEHKDAVHWANKAFESTMKVVCHKRGWAFPSGARASDLLKVLRQHSLWPTYLDASFDQLAATLASGLPQLRNNAAGHGEGATVTETPDYVAAYALHLASAKILFIAGAAADTSQHSS